MRFVWGLRMCVHVCVCLPLFASVYQCQCACMHACMPECTCFDVQARMWVLCADAFKYIQINVEKPGQTSSHFQGNLQDQYFSEGSRLVHMCQVFLQNVPEIFLWRSFKCSCSRAGLQTHSSVTCLLPCLWFPDFRPCPLTYTHERSGSKATQMLQTEKGLNKTEHFFGFFVIFPCNCV